jgi:hypothetical protein
MRQVYCDGGAKCNPPEYKFSDAYFVVVDESGNEIHSDHSLGDIYSGLAEWEAISWAVKNIQERPLTITSDCYVAINWANSGSKNYNLAPLDLAGVDLRYEKHNLADKFNSIHTSPKFIPNARREQLRKLIIFEFGEACYVANGDDTKGDYNVEEAADNILNTYFKKPKND